MKSIAVLISLAFVLAVGCTPRATPTPTITPSETAAPPVPTDTPTATLMPTQEPVSTEGLSSLQMFLNGGWGIDQAGGRLLRTTDGGITWTQMSLPEGTQDGLWRSFFLDETTGWVPGNQAFVHTEDGGQTWSEIPVSGLELRPEPVILKFISPTVGWVEQYDGGAGSLYVQVFKTEDGGGTFAVVPIVPPEPEPNLPEGMLHLCNICSDSFYYDPSRIVIVEGDLGSMQSRGTVHAKTSFDLGGTWNEVSVALPAGYEDALVWPLEVAFIDDANGFMPVLLVKYTGSAVDYRVMALYTSEDGGQTWTLAPAVLEGISTFPSLQFVSTQDIFAVCEKAICATHDGSQTWQSMPLDEALLPNDTRSISQMEFVDASTGWLVVRETTGDVSSYALYKTTDGGVTWTGH